MKDVYNIRGCKKGNYQVTAVIIMNFIAHKGITQHICLLNQVAIPLHNINLVNNYILSPMKLTPD